MKNEDIDELTIQQNILSTEELESWLIDKYNEQRKEIERLNNIINELEKWLLFAMNYEDMHRLCKCAIKDTYNKLQELKGDGSNEY